MAPTFTSTIDAMSALDRTMELPTGAAAYRIVQESLTNALKHAGPARIDVTIECSDDDLTVTVSDDGLGAAAPTVPGGGRGIAGMTERANVLGGRLIARPIDGGGFLVKARIPRTAEARVAAESADDTRFEQ